MPPGFIWVLGCVSLANLSEAQRLHHLFTIDSPSLKHCFIVFHHSEAFGADLRPACSVSDGYYWYKLPAAAGPNWRSLILPPMCMSAGVSASKNSAAGRYPNTPPLMQN